MQLNNEAPLVSIVMPAYNAGPFLAEAISSVQAQTITDWELLVIDDGSSDNTCQIATEFAEKDSRIRLIVNEENMGVARTRNRGMDLCSGRYLALLDSDDYWKPQLLEKMLAKIKETKADLVYCSYELVDEEGKRVCNDFIVSPSTNFEESIVRNVISCSTVLFTKNLIDKYRFPTNMYHEDIALWFQILRDGYIAMGVTEVLAAYRQRANSRSSGKLSSAKKRWSIYREFLGMSFLKSVVTMARYGYYGLIKYKRIAN